VSERNEATESLLDTRELDFPFADGRPLKEVLADLHSATGLKFAIDRSAEDADLSTETEITFSAESLRYRTGLDLLLEPYNCTYTIRDGLVLLISCDASSDPYFFRLKTFEIEELLQLIIRAERLEDQEQLVPVAASAGGLGGVGGGATGGAISGDKAKALGGCVFSLLPVLPHEATEEGAAAEAGAAAPRAVGQSPTLLGRVVKTSAKAQAQQKLIDYLQNNVAPDEWSVTGNGDGTVEAVGGVLVVGQSEKILSGVGEALHDLTRKLKAIEARERK